MSAYVLRGNIIHTPTKDQFQIVENGYLFVEGGKCKWISSVIEKNMILDEKNQQVTLAGDKQSSIPFIDYKDMLIIPSFIDLHVHAPQYLQMGIGLDLPLIEWLYHYTFRIEERFANVNYARKCYPSFVQGLYDNGSLRSVIFGTIHNESNKVLVEELAKHQLSALVGKVNMNRFAPVNLIETVERSLRDTVEFIEIVKDINNPGILPIVTPRFAPSCTSELLGELGEIAKEYNLPVQSHLCETTKEIAWVKALFNQELKEGEDAYSDIYYNNGLFGQQPTVMAHGVYLDDRDLRLAIENNVFIVHCPTSNLNLTSGVMPLAEYIDKGLSIGLGSDIGAGHTMAMNQVIVSAIQNGKMRHVFFDERCVLDSEAFYLATRGNGLFLEQVFTEEKIGTFESGFSFDALIINDDHPLMDSNTPMEQLQRFLYCGTASAIKYRYLKGKLI